MTAMGCQTKALAHVAARAERARADARAQIIALLGSAPAPQIDDVLTRLRGHATVTLNFHPDRLLRDGRTVAEGLLEEGRYRSQFETGVSNGSRTAFAGGDRDRWEKSLFGGAYHDEPSALEHRPKYGALNLMLHADGGSPRFGSCYFELRPWLIERCTLTWGDSHEGPEHVGTLDVLEPVLAALLASTAATGAALGVAGMDAARLMRALESLQRPDAPTNVPSPEPTSEHASAWPARGNGPCGRALDAYIEAQVHGDIALASDIESLVIDPSFVETPTGNTLRDLASRYGIALLQHPGFVLAPSDVPDNFRGRAMVPLATRVARTFASEAGHLDAATIGRAARSLQLDPDSWHDWATAPETLQHLKQLWHVLVRFGAPAPPRPGPPPNLSGPPPPPPHPTPLPGPPHRIR